MHLKEKLVVGIFLGMNAVGFGNDAIVNAHGAIANFVLQTAQELVNESDSLVMTNFEMQTGKYLADEFADYRVVATLVKEEGQSIDCKGSLRVKKINMGDETKAESSILSVLSRRHLLSVRTSQFECKLDAGL